MKTHFSLEIITGTSKLYAGFVLHQENSETRSRPGNPEKNRELKQNEISSFKMKQELRSLS